MVHSQTKLQHILPKQYDEQQTNDKINLMTVYKPPRKGNKIIQKKNQVEVHWNEANEVK